MQQKENILAIDTDLDFISKLDESLKNKVNLIFVQSIEEALRYCNIDKNSKSSQTDISLALIIIGDGCKISKELKRKIKEEYPNFFDEEAWQTFEPLFYCNLLCNAFQTSSIQRPRGCICANLEKYPFKGSNQDITKKLSYCMQHNIPLMNKTEKKQKLILNVLRDYIFKLCNIKENKFNR